MKITKQGCLPANANLYKGTCGNCRTEAECFEKELDSIKQDYDGDYYAFTKCPFCNCSMRFDFFKRLELEN